MAKRFGATVGLAALVALVASGCGGGGGSGSGDGGPADSSVLPRVVHAEAPSTHYVDVTFAAAAGAKAERPETYVITAPDGARLRVDEVHLNADRTGATLVTDTQQAVLYTLAVVSAPSAAGGAAAGTPTPLEVSFMGSSIAEAQLKSASAVDNTHVVLVFSKAADAATGIPP